jgi:hypothetical protein
MERFRSKVCKVGIKFDKHSKNMVGMYKSKSKIFFVTKFNFKTFWELKKLSDNFDAINSYIRKVQHLIFIAKKIEFLILKKGITKNLFRQKN